MTMKRWQTLKVRKDIASGKSGDGRQGFQELLADIRAERLDVVIVYRLDRLSRNVWDIYDFLDLIRRCNVGFVSVTEGFDTTTAMGRAMLGVAAVFAQLTREMIAENTRDGILRRVEAGHFIGNMAGAYGYSLDRDKGMIVPEAEEAVVVRQVFEWYVERKWGNDKIARVLNATGVPTKRGRIEGCSEAQWKPLRVANILRNPLYCGMLRLRRTPINGSAAPDESGGNSTAGGRTGRGHVLEGLHEPIITPELFEAAQQIVKSRGVLPPRSHSSVHLLSGIATCGICGRKLKAHHQASGMAPDGNRRKYISYLHQRSVEATGSRACPGLSKGADKLERAVIGYFTEIGSKGLFEQVALEELQSREQSGSDALKAERDSLAVELAGIAQKFTKWADRLDGGSIDEEQFDMQNRRLLHRKHEVSKRLSELQSTITQYPSLEVTLTEVKQALSDFSKVWAALEPEEKREMLRLLIEDLRLYKDRICIKVLFLPEQRQAI